MENPISAKSALLAALVSGKGYGLELIDRIRERTKGRVRVNQGSIYPALRALEKAGLVRSIEADASPERGGRPRYYYELTADGLRAAREERKGILGLMALAEVN
jgi:PadR family transcriptional regulator PadR